MGYVERNLTAGESVIYRARSHWIGYFWPAVFTVLGLYMVSDKSSRDAGMGVFVLAALLILRALVLSSTNEFVVTNKRVVLKAGIIRRRTVELFLTKVESVSVDQGILGRLLGYGAITIRGMGGTGEPFKRIAAPLEFRHHVQDQMEQRPERLAVA